MPRNAGGRGRDYREAEVRTVLERGPEWDSWSQAVEWLRRWGPRDDETRSGDVRELLLRDFTRLEHDSVPFTHEPGEAYRLAHEHRPKRAGIERETGRARR